MTTPGQTRPILVSACLLGRRCRYDGQDSYDAVLDASLESSEIIPVCPEELAGLATPRPAAHFVAGDGHAVLDGAGRIETVETGTDITDAFISGANETLRIARDSGAHRGILKDGSPSCGVARISVCGSKVRGRGVTAALLSRAGLHIEGRP